jgi:hypothetical protein
LPFSLLSPPDGDTVAVPILLDWEDSEDPNASDTVRYKLYVSSDSLFLDPSTMVVDSLTESEHLLTFLPMLSHTFRNDLIVYETSMADRTRAIDSETDRVAVFEREAVRSASERTDTHERQADLERAGHDNATRSVKGAHERVNPSTRGLESSERIAEPELLIVKKARGIVPFFWKVQAYDGRGGIQWSLEDWSFVSSFPCGDANGDSLVSTGDGFAILNYYGSGPALLSCWSANVNGDSILTTGDGFYLLNFFGSGPALNCAPCDF